MNEIEKYEFDRVGYLVIKGMLTSNQVSSLAVAVDELEAHALLRIQDQTVKTSNWGPDVRFDKERHYHALGQSGDGNTLLIQDFWNASAAFDMLLSHQHTLDYINQVIVGRYTINNSEIRIRYSGNGTGSHSGGPVIHKVRYGFNGGRIDCMMVRMIYFLHDVDIEQGPFSVVPATHKSNYGSPYRTNQDNEPGMIGLPVRAGDAILFTENLRHGGLTNRSTQVRKTLHVGYGPHWMLSQNNATADEPPYITEATRLRLSKAQNDLFRAWIPGQKYHMRLDEVME